MKKPVFIVGVPRSGTTLLAAMLSAHSQMICGPETHFFRRLSETDPQKLCDRQTWPEPATSFISSIKHSGFSGHESKYLLEKYRLEPAQIKDYLRQKEPSISNILAAVTEQYMRKMGKHRWIEKTPDHIMYPPLIRRYFPESPILRIVRDPRDVALSLTKVPWGARSFPEALFYWQRLHTASETFFTEDKLSYTVRFEDLLTSPQQELQHLCQFIDEEFEAVMLDTSHTGKQINSRNVPWKARASHPPDKGRIFVWREALTKDENQLAEALLGNHLTALGYPLEETFGQLGEFYPSSDLALKYADGLKYLTSKNGMRFWKTHPDEESTTRVYLGDPGKDRWLKEGKLAKVTGTISISADIIKSGFSPGSVYWVSDREETWSGYCAYILHRLLTPYKVTPEKQTAQLKP